MKQTAVEWLVKELESYGNTQFCKIEWEQLDLLIEQAKEMEKEQIMDAYIQGSISLTSKNDAEQYYKETYIANRDMQ
jgi:lantibiotic modifying enzyme